MPSKLNSHMSVDEIESWHMETRVDKTEELYDFADQTRRRYVGDAVWFRGLVELSNHCRRNCLYCGVRAARQLERYRMTRAEILDCARKAHEWKFGTLVMQAGEDLALDEGLIADLIVEIKERFSLAITLSLGERKEREWRRWKEAGADRYLLRFETSNQELFRVIHPAAPNCAPQDRIALLRLLRSIGYEVGSGVMIGVPGQSFSDLARDLALFRDLDLDMIGCGPFLPHADTPLGRLEKIDGRWQTKGPNDNQVSAINHFNYPTVVDQVPNDLATTFKVVALTRILLPNANIPSTTAIATVDGQMGRKSGLERGGNVVMPNLTPMKYRKLYEIYPDKAGSDEDAERTTQTALRQISEIGRFQGEGTGSSQRFLARHAR